MRKALTSLVLAGLFVTVLAAPQPAAAQGDIEWVETAAIPDSANTVWRQALAAAINPDDYVCEPGLIDQWIGELLSATDFATLDTLFMFGSPDWPIVYKLFFDNDDTDEFIGVDGRYTREHAQRERDLINFWDVPLDDVDLYGMHGAVIADDAKMVPVVQFLFGVSATEAQGIVDLVQATIVSDPTIGYDWPLFSFNAVAFGPDPLKIVMGDGLIAFFEDTRLANNGVDVVYAHEMAHHIQGVLDVFAEEPSPEATRRTELMADAFSVYFLVHARGAAFNKHRALDTFEVSFISGDCAFDSPGHHGTPNQRRLAAEWGADVARDRPQGQIKSAASMVALFDAELPTIVAPDAP